MGIFRERIAIDLGTAYSIVAHESSAKFLRIPSNIALDAATRSPVAYGDDAKIMMGKAPVNQFELIRPLKDGVISNFEAAGHYLSYLVQRSRKNPLALQYDILVCVPWGATAVEVKSYIERVKSFRTSIKLVREPFAAALGCDLDVFSANGCTVIDIGGGTVEISTIAHGHMIFCSSIRAAGNAMDQMIVEKMLRQKLFEVGVNTAEEIKMKYGSVYPEDDEEEFEVRGLDRRTHGPGRTHLRTETLRDFLEPLILEIENRLKSHLKGLPPDIQRTVLSQGIYLVGGGALLKGWKTRFQKKLGVHVTIPEEPQYAVIRGMQKILSKPRLYRSLLKVSQANH
ncbi:MAG: rod shape-determining protein [Deltaproteobacteria bacterium]|nr:rod shape-determining protein [Deltaproteobacteria bacterium]